MSDISTSEPEIRRGLAGVVADRSAVSLVVQETNNLTYRGYPVPELAARCSFEEVAYLIWHGELPDADQLAAFTARERAGRELDPATVTVISTLPTDCHPMDVLRTAVSAIGAAEPGEEIGDVETELARAESLFAKLPTALALDHRRRHGLEPIAPDPALGFSENLFQMCFGEVPAPELVAAFDVSMILYAEHGFNASTFAARVVTSTLSDTYSAVTAAIGALKGPLHGGANEAVMRMMTEVGDPAGAAEWLRGELAAKRKIMGFGHRVYRDGDSRVPTMKQALVDVAARTDGQRWIELYDALAAAMLEQKGIHPNLDFPSGPAYHLMGFDTETFTPLFVLSRITGWTAHIAEQRAANALIRPLSFYDGVAERPVPTR